MAQYEVWEETARVDRTWEYQVRVYLAEAHVEAARSGTPDPALAAILQRHHASLKCQLDAFTEYVAETERDAAADDPLYRWTVATLADPVRRARHLQAFAVRVDDQVVYPQAIADALAAELQTLVGGGVVERISRQDNNPANNLPVPEQYRTAG